MLCKCGCGSDVREGHSFVYGHNRRSAELSLMLAPNPSGLCKCGCGKKTLLAFRTVRNRGIVKGQPIKYVFGHYNLSNQIKADAHKGRCQCGCRNKAPLAESSNKRLGRVKGKPFKFIQGHQRPKSYASCGECGAVVKIFGGGIDIERTCNCHEIETNCYACGRKECRCKVASANDVPAPLAFMGL